MTHKIKSLKVKIFLPTVIVSLLGVIALFDNPYGYYIFLRFAVTTLLLYLAYIFREQNLEQNKTNKYWLYFFVFILLAVFFNPIFPIYMSRDNWLFFDVCLILGVPLMSYLFYADADY